MAVTPVSLGPSLRAWAQAGLTHILCDGAVDPVFLGNASPGNGRDSSPPGRSPMPSTPPSTPHTPHGEEGGGTGRSATQTQPMLSSTAPSSARRSSDKASAEHASSAAFSGLLTFASRSGVPSDPTEWPEPWSGWFAKIVPAQILWTYHELGADLAGKNRSPERSRFFKDLIGELRLPKGSSVFWPAAMPVADASGEARLLADAALYSAGISRLMPQLVIIFGEKTLEDIGLEGKIQPLRQAMVEGKPLLCLPDIDILLRSQAQRASSISLLRAVLASANLSY